MALGVSDFLYQQLVQVLGQRELANEMLTAFGGGDNNEIYVGDGNDAGIQWALADSSNHAMVMFVGDTSQQLHITDKGARDTDWARSAGTHPELSIHSNTTPATDYLAIGNHDGTTATIDVVGGTTLNLDLDGTNKVALASDMTLASGHVTMGDGGTVTQATNKSTGVTLSTESGQITMNNAALGDDTTVEFTVTNTKVGAQDVVLAALASGNTAGAYTLTVDAVAAGSFKLSLRNHSGGSLGEAVVINFVVIGGSSS